MGTASTQDLIQQQEELLRGDYMLQRLAVHVVSTFRRNSDHRRESGVDAKLMKCLRLVKSEYSQAEKKIFQEKGAPEIFMPIADMKRRAALALFTETFAIPGNTSWTVNPTPVPEVPPDITLKAVDQTMMDFIEYVQTTGIVPTPEMAFSYAQDRMTEVLNEEAIWAKTRSELMEKEVHDIMVEGDWIDAFAQYCQYLCDYGTAVIRGPVPRMVYRKKLVKTKGASKFVMKPELVLFFEAISPFDCFPSKGARKIEHGDICFRRRYTPFELHMFGKMTGKEWKLDAIQNILSRYPDGGIWLDLPGEAERRMMENSVGDLGGQCTIEGIEFFGEVRGSYLKEIGLEKDSDRKSIDDEQYYETNTIVIDNKVVYCRIIEPQIGRCLAKGTFYTVSDSWWGDAIVEKCESTQRICNAAVRDLVVNMAQSSGPQTVIKDISRLHPSCSPDQSPWKVWLFEASVMGNSENPLHVFQPNSNVHELLKVFDWGMKQADNDTGIPAYTYGAAMAGGAGRTASGLEMMLESVNRGIKSVVMETDREVVRRIVKMIVDWVMLYSEKEHIKGDFEVNPGGVLSLVFREGGSVRRRAFLQLLQNPIVAQTILPSGIAAIVREEAKTLDLNPDDIIPSREKLKELDEMAVIQRQIMLANSMAESGAGQSGMLPMQGQGQPPPAPEGMPRAGLSPAMSVGEGQISQSGGAE